MGCFFVFLSSAKVIIAKKPLSVNTFFPLFLIIFSKEEFFPYLLHMKGRAIL